VKHALIITCEHATNYVPVCWRGAFAGKEDVLLTHRAWDPGALVLAEELAAQFDAQVFKGQVTRLLVDLSRRVESKDVFSEFSRPLGADKRKLLLHLYHWPFRISVQDAVAEHIRRGHRVLHLSCHSFTPVLKGSKRNAEIGLLFNPRRKPEAGLCAAWQRKLARALPESRVRANYPYRGTSDGTTTWLRKQFPANRYSGIEIELNQAFAAQPPSEWSDVRRAFVDCVQRARTQPI
jgi:predicted N-formylglutamate amidohydrolase